MGSFRDTVEMFEALAEHTSTRLDIAEEANRKTNIYEDIDGIREDLEGAVPVDDGIPPNPPDGINVVRRNPTVGGISVTWNYPNTESPEWVRRARVRFRLVGNVTWQEAEADLGAGVTLLGLDGEETPGANHEAQVKFIDFFGLESDWFPAIPQAAQAEAYIPYLAVDQLRGGTIFAEAITLTGTGGSASELILAGDSKMRLNDGTQDKIRLFNKGIELLKVTDMEAEPPGAVGQMIGPIVQTPSNANNFAGIWFFEDTSGGANRRGVNIRATGPGGTGLQGRVALVATKGPNTPSSNTSDYASIYVDPNISAFDNKAGVIIRHSLQVVGPMRISGRLDGANIDVNQLDGGGQNHSIDAGLLPNIDVNKLTGGGEGHNIDAGLLPDGVVFRSELPDMGNYAKKSDVEKLPTKSWVMGKIRDATKGGGGKKKN